jgi:alanine dehydrogenase
MIISIPKEIKDKEFRVGMTPGGVKTLISTGHTVIVEQSAGVGSGFSDLEYEQAGAAINASAAEVYEMADMVVKVKEPLPVEYTLLKENLILFTFLHLPPNPELTDALLEKMVVGIAYETVQLDDGSLPLLAPMSAVAGRMAIQVGAHYLEKEAGGRGILLGGVPGVKRGHVTILGSGTVGSNACDIAVGMDAEVTVLGRNIKRLAELEDIYASRITTLASNQQNIEEQLEKADLVIGAVLVPGCNAPKLISYDMLSKMKNGSVLVDVSIDQGGCAETSMPTTHSDPVFEVDGVIHYCVANMPGAVPRTSTLALTNVSLPYVKMIADNGLMSALQANEPLFKGVNVFDGKLVHMAVAEAQGREWEPLII